MIVSGWVVTLKNDGNSLERAQNALGADPRMTCGPMQGLRLPVVAETASLAEGESLCESLRTMEGVEFVDVVSIDFGDELAAEVS